jgi:hypothetical protein
MPGHVIVDTATFEDLGERTLVRIHSTPRASATGLGAGMQRGLNESYATLDQLLGELASG